MEEELIGVECGKSATAHIEELLDIQRADESCLVPTLLVTGCAGTGKTFAVRQLENTLLAATTGIAGVNLGTSTIHSILKYFDTESLEDHYARGRLAVLFHRIGQEYDNICIDEVSMADPRQLDMWYRSIAEVNQYEGMVSKGRKLGLILTGDFMQLPPVKCKWAFTAECWPYFAANTLRLTKVWRHGNPDFLRALNLMRAGDGAGAAEILRELIHWMPSINRKFDGTTVVSKNMEVDRHNWLALSELTTPLASIPKLTWGKQLGEWEKNIPGALDVKVGAYVMILANSRRENKDADGDGSGGSGSSGFFKFDQELEYANGDCGWITDIDTGSKTVGVKLVRNGETVRLGRITRENLVREEPDEGWTLPGGVQPYWDSRRRKWVVGSITFMPLRLAYASTVHRSQGLTLDRIQVDCRAHFFGMPAMAYVSLSRAREPQGVYVVGTPRLLATRTKVDEEVLPWL